MRKVSKEEEIQALKELDVYGYAAIENFITPQKLEELKNLVEFHYGKINDTERVSYKGVPERDKYDKILYNLQNKDKAFIDILTNETVRTIAMKKLNDPYYRFLPEDKPNYTLLYYNARSSGSKLDLHIDSHIPFVGPYTSMMQFAFTLEDHFIGNGCTTVVPGSHQSGRYTDRELANVKSIEVPAGTLVCWDSRLWHGTNENKDKKSRWALIATMGMWWVKPSMDIVGSMEDKIYQHLSDEQKQLLGFCAIPPSSEFERNNTKNGYDFLKPSVKDYRN